ncbi:glycosyltransferase [Luteithermobacter gelatinilyticus]|uniref:glycosyltransferase n=1 Tax=Luteithermobacter gelatinilyticus TaxID=2582913 RepID=UPI001105CF6B|nr:glycosyltransferase [Luteithermobacter gelatinilyticus]
MDTKKQKIIAFFPEAAYGPALNSVAIAQACEKRGHKAVFICDPGFRGVFEKYGFDEYEVHLSEPMPPEAMSRYWVDFVNRHIPNFRLSPEEQIDNYIRECWEATVDTAIWAHKELPDVLNRINPDLICMDAVIMHPAIKQHGVPWVRITSCSENEIPDENIPPYLSGLSQDDKEGFVRFRAHYDASLKDVHDKYNAFLAECGIPPYPPTEFCETSPYLNLLLYPDVVRFARKIPLDPARFQYLEGCVRQDDPYEIPEFRANKDAPLLYISFGSLGAGDTALMKRVIRTIGKLAVRALVNVGEHIESYDQVPDNVHLASWYPQPSVIPQVDAVIHHGGNNSFTECLYFGKPAIIMSYCWDGHDNAMRIQETGHGLKLDRYNWAEEDLARAIERVLTDRDMHQKLHHSKTVMQAAKGPAKAAALLDALLDALLGQEMERS